MAHASSTGSVKHTCHATGCKVEVPEARFMCRKHWYLLPKGMRDAIWREYVPGQEISKTPTQEYLDAAHEAIRYIESIYGG